MFGFGSINLYQLAIGFAILIMSISVHEASHAMAAYTLGDLTAKRLGRLTLNPIAHLDPLGTIMMLIMLSQHVGIGWGKPTPVNPYNLRPGPKNGMALVSLAGPVSNLAIATTLAIPLRAGGIQGALLQSIVFSAVVINISLTVFNLIPLPPLDGFKVLQGILPNRQANALSGLENYGPAVLLVIIFFGPYIGINIFGTIMSPIMNVISLAILGTRLY